MADARDEALRADLRRLLQARSQPPEACWGLARDLGPCASPLLWQLLDEAAGEARLRLLAALVAAGGIAEDERLLRWVGTSACGVRERQFVAYLLALGPDRAQVRTDVFERLRAGSAFANLLAMLAAARFRRDGSALEFDVDDDPGLAGAAMLAGVPVRWTPPRGTRHEGLFWRGAFLGGARHGATATVRERAMAMRAEAGDGQAEVRLAAQWCCVRSGDGLAADARPDAAGLAVLAGDAAARRQHADWFQMPPGPRDAQPERLAVAFALSARFDDVVAARANWPSAPAAAALALTLAWRAAHGERPTAPLPAWPETPAWRVLQLACGVAEDAGAALADAALARAADRARVGALPPAAFAAAIEAALWRADVHPGLVPVRLERAYVRDLVLAGSQTGGGKWQPAVPPEQRYFAAGLGRAEPWFDVAVAYYEWNEAPTGAPPEPLRLPHR